MVGVDPGQHPGTTVAGFDSNVSIPGQACSASDF